MGFDVGKDDVRVIIQPGTKLGRVRLRVTLPGQRPERLRVPSCCTAVAVPERPCDDRSGPFAETPWTVPRGTCVGS
jgi:hypothetical protein